MKFFRLAATLEFLLLAFLARSAAIDAAVIMHEIQYHPAAGDTEWIELHSLSGVDIDMSGWRLVDAVEFTFPEGTKISGHGYLTVAANPGAATLAGVGALGPWTGELNNAGERITLVNRDGREMDVLEYKDSGDWPVGADGSGATLARRNGESADPDARSWTTSAEIGGTPGRANFAVPGQAPTVTAVAQLDSAWKYFVGAPPAGWQQPSFDDSGWASGPSLLYSGAPTLGGGSEGLAGYWPLEEATGSAAPNLAPGGSAATLFNNPAWVTDAQRGRVLQFNGANQYANAGSAIIPQMTLTNDFTWAFWANSAQGPNSSVMLGNRYSPTAGVDWNPREFIKFTTSTFEFHRSGAGENLDYAPIAANSGWMHHAMVKTGSTLTYYRNGAMSASRTISQGLVHPQPLYFAGDQNQEFWAGKLDDVAIWTRALTAAQVGSLNSGAATPLNVSNAGTLRTQLPEAASYGFRRAFTFSGSPSRTTLTLKLLVEDGCTVWLNGQQVHTQNNPPSSGTAAADVSGEIAIPNSALVKGNNVLAVEVRTFASEPDMVFGASLVLSEQAPAAGDTSPALVFNEISPGGSGFQLELANLGGDPADLTGYTIRSSSGASAVLSGTLNAGAFLTVNAAQLGFTPVSGDRIFLFKPGGAELSDAREVTGRLRGRSAQHPECWLFPSSATFGSANAFTFHTDVVINEIMYDQRPLSQAPFTEDPEQWIELYNKGSAPVALGGWRFTEGIEFEFAAGANIPPGGYLVVANNRTALQAKWPAAGNNIVGNFSGSIQGKGERLQLSDASGNPVDEVTFAGDEPWPVAAHGGGSSMELRDARADNDRPEAWGASDESGRGLWQTYTYEGQATPGVGSDPTQWNEFIFGLLDRGSFLIDDISVIESPSGANRQIIQNGTFESGGSTWRFLGTHRRATVITDPSGTGQVLRMDATGATEHMHNHAETTLKSAGTEVTINSSLTYRISFRARWLSGSNQLNTRLYFNRLARITRLAVAPGGGTPAAPNTATVANLGPTFSGLLHAPAVPAPNQPALVTVVANDPDNVGAVALFYAVNGGAFANLPMESQGGGRFRAAIPGQAAGAKVQFYVQAADGLGAIGFAPPGGASSRAIIPWDDGQARLVQNGVMPTNIRMVMTPGDVSLLHTPTNVMSNDRLGCTVIWNERDVYYDCGTHLRGSQRGRNQPTRVSFNLRFPGDKLLLGVQDSIVVDRSGAGNQTSQKEILIKRAITHAGGLPGSEDDLCRLIAPQPAHTGPALLGRQRIVTGEYLDSAYENGGEGDLFKYELVYYPTTTVDGNREGLKLPEPDSVTGVGVGSLGSNKEAYRWHWLISNNEEEDDYSGLMTFLTAFGRSPDAQYFTEMSAMIDVSEWLRSFAIETLFGIGDNYGTGSQHNLYLYRRPADGRWIFFPHDMDFTFTSRTDSPMFQSGDLNKLVSTARPQGVANLRTYWAHVYDLCQTTFSSAYLRPWAVHYSAFASEDLTQFMGYIDARRAYALSQLGSAIPQVAFEITTPDGSAPGPTVTIAGKAWVDVAQMRLAGSSVPLNLTWTSTTNWQATVVIAPGPNAITINAYNSQGALVGADSVNINGTGTIVPANATNLVISEIMYHPGDPSGAEQGAGFTDAEVFEFIELQNISPTDIIGLHGVQFTAGISFDFPAATLAPGARLLVVGNQAAFTQRYGANSTIAGQYQPTRFLANSGDHIQLVDGRGQVLRDFSYGDDAPWPTSPDGLGFSLVLLNPASNPDHADPLNWRGSVSIGGNPGASDATTFTGDPNADDNGEGINNLLQYALAGTTPVQLPTAANDGGFLTISFRRNLAADDARITVQRSTDLRTWTSGEDVASVSETRNADGTATYVWRSTHSFVESPREFLRLRVVK